MQGTIATTGRSFLGLAILTFGGLDRVVHAHIMTVFNDMEEPVWLFVKSEHRERWHGPTRIGRGTQVQIPLASADKFELVTTDRQSSYYYSALLPLRAMLDLDPAMVIDLREIVEGQTIAERYWTRRWGWRTRQRNVEVRTLVIYTFVESNGDEDSLAAPKLRRTRKKEEIGLWLWLPEGWQDIPYDVH